MVAGWWLGRGTTSGEEEEEEEEEGSFRSNEKEGLKARDS
jgi:hypothetical protein